MPLPATSSNSGPERPCRLVKLPEVLARTALSRSEVYRRVRDDPFFPKPTKLGVRSVAWVESEIQEYVLACIAQRDAKAVAA